MKNNIITKTLLTPLSLPMAMMLGAGLLAIVSIGILRARAGDESGGVMSRAKPGFFRTEGDKEYLRASRPDQDPHWFDITGSKLDKSGFQYGIGKDTIEPIDNPVFVEPDDPRLLSTGRDRIGKTDDLKVFGYADGKEAYAYPIGLLDHHELVNHVVAGRPITAGW